MLGSDISIGGHEMNNIYMIMVAGAVLSGCASTDSVRDAPETKGEQRSFDVGYGHMVSLIETTFS